MRTYTCSLFYSGRTLKNKTLSNTQANTPPPPPPPPIQINIPADSSNGPPSSTVRFAEHHNTYAEVEEKSEDYEQLFQKQAKMNMKYPQSDLSVPGLHSSKVGVLCFIVIYYFIALLFIYCFIVY